MHKYALIGHNISYSKSPQLHEIIGMAAEDPCSYDLIDIKGEELEETIARLAKEYEGFNITKPFKETVVTRELLDALSPPIQILGAVNTVGVKDGMTFGYNTDNVGFFQSLKMNNVPLIQGWKGLILGAGGAARAAVSVLSTAVELTVCNRTLDRAQKMLAALHLDENKACTPETLEGDFDFILNATTLGLDGENCLPASVDLSKAKVCYDMIYEPEETPFLAAAREAGVETVCNGRWMLISQAILSQQVWHGKDFTAEQMGEILRAIDAMF